MRDPSLPGREFVVSGIPFANPGDPVRSVDNFLRSLLDPPVTTVTSGEWSLLHSPQEGVSELYNLTSDPGQQENVIHENPYDARELHRFLIKFMRQTAVPNRLLSPRLELRA